MEKTEKSPQEQAKELAEDPDLYVGMHISNLEHELEQTKKELQSAQSDLSEAEAEIIRLKQEHEYTKNSNESLQKAYSEEFHRRRKLEPLQKEVESMQSRYDRATEACNDLKRALESEQANHARIQQKFAYATAIMQELQIPLAKVCADHQNALQGLLNEATNKKHQASTLHKISNEKVIEGAPSTNCCDHEQTRQTLEKQQLQIEKLEKEMAAVQNWQKVAEEYFSLLSTKLYVYPVFHKN